jgi:hypothetical protein
MTEPVPPSPEQRLHDQDEKLIAHFAWKDVLRRAPGIPTAVLWEIAQGTKEMVPHLGDPIASLEWHITKVIDLARQVVNKARVDNGLFPVLYYTALDSVAAHLYRDADGREVECETLLPAAVCECGRHVLELAGVPI